MPLGKMKILRKISQGEIQLMEEKKVLVKSIMMERCGRGTTALYSVHVCTLDVYQSVCHVINVLSYE